MDSDSPAAGQMGTNTDLPSCNLKRGPLPRAVAPEDHDKIRTLWLEGQTLSEMASATGIPRSTLHKFIDSFLKPLARRTHAREIGIVLQEIQMLRAFAWQQLRACGNELRQVTVKAAYRAAKQSGRTRKVAKKLAGVVERVTRRMPNAQARHWGAIIEWCIEQECKMAGHYRATSAPEAEFRMAGKSRGQITAEMVQKIVSRIEERREEMEAYQIHCPTEAADEAE